MPTSLSNASACAHDTRAWLQESLRESSALRALVILPLIERAALLMRDIDALIDANSKDTE